MAENENDMKELLQELVTFTKEWKLEINQDKSQIMRTKTTDKETRTWNIEAEGEVVEMKETDIYLGVYFNRDGNIFKEHLNDLARKGKSKINAIKIIASESINRIWTADALWKGAAKPTILYASEVLKINKTEMKKIESLQGEMGRWILKGNGGMPNAGIRGN